MSEAVICDECGRIVNRRDAMHCAESNTHTNGLVYGADICDNCLQLFDKSFRADGWHLTYKEQWNVKLATISMRL